MHGDIHRFGCFKIGKPFRIVTQQETIDHFSWRFLRFSSHTLIISPFEVQNAARGFLLDVDQIEFQRELSATNSWIGLLKEILFDGNFGSFLSRRE
jgi:hypothetical protein